jgi:hypothetical protein
VAEWAAGQPAARPRAARAEQAPPRRRRDRRDRHPATRRPRACGGSCASGCWSGARPTSTRARTPLRDLIRCGARPAPTWCRAQGRPPGSPGRCRSGTAAPKGATSASRSERPSTPPSCRKTPMVRLLRGLLPARQHLASVDRQPVAAAPLVSPPLLVAHHHQVLGGGAGLPEAVGQTVGLRGEDPHPAAAASRTAGGTRGGPTRRGAPPRTRRSARRPRPAARRRRRPTAPRWPPVPRAAGHWSRRPRTPRGWRRAHHGSRGTARPDR